MTNLAAGVSELIRQLIAERNDARRQVAELATQVTDMAADVLRLDNDLIDARGQIETLEEQLAGALAELHAWKMVATAND